MAASSRRPRRRAGLFPRFRAEPGLDEILADPIVCHLMARDGVGIGDIRYLVALVRDRCRRDEASPPAPTSAAP